MMVQRSLNAVASYVRGLQRCRLHLISHSALTCDLLDKRHVFCLEKEGTSGQEFDVLRSARRRG